MVRNLGKATQLSCAQMKIFKKTVGKKKKKKKKVDTEDAIGGQRKRTE